MARDFQVEPERVRLWNYKDRANWKNQVCAYVLHVYSVNTPDDNTMLRRKTGTVCCVGPPAVECRFVDIVQ